MNQHFNNQHQLQQRFTVGWRAIVAGLVLVAVAGCARPPVAEIASAEAALQSARDAGAARLAPEPLAEADALMLETYRQNDDKNYDEARDTAIETRSKAEYARDLALRSGASEDHADGDGGRLQVKTEAETRAIIAEEEIGSGTMEEGSRLSSLEPVYFAFDDYSVAKDELPKIESAAVWLKENPSATIQVEGHTDERGSSDYNFALGSRRADSVRQILASHGIEAPRIRTRSYGEEIPAQPGHDDESWAANRRAEFVVLQ